MTQGINGRGTSVLVALIAGATLTVSVVAGIALGGSLKPRLEPIAAFGDGPPPAGLEAALDAMFPEDDCVSARDAGRRIGDVFGKMGLQDWTVTRGVGVTDEGCVGAAVYVSTHRVTLFQALHPDLRKGLEAAESRLLSDCLNGDEAEALIRSVVSQNSSDGWEIRRGSGVAGPGDRIEEIKRHVDRGCWIYRGTGWTEEGARLYWISGR
jgi:hypothetical protein